MGNVRVAHYLASFHKNVIFVKTRYCFICPPYLAEKDCVHVTEVQKLTRTSIFEPQCDYLAFALIQVARIKIQRILIRAVYKLCRLQRLGNACKNGSHLLQCSYV